MRKLILLAAMAITSAANAALLISVDGVIDPPDTEITLLPSDMAVIGIWGDGSSPQGTYYLGVQEGNLATLDASNMTMIYPAEIPMPPTPEPPFPGWITIELYNYQPDPPPLEGMLVDQIILHCENPGEASVLLLDHNLEVLDTQVIHQIPEPTTIAILALGGLALRRRKKQQ